MHTLVAPPAFTDNFIWMLHDDARALVVDPGEAAPVHAALDTQGLELAAILVTHHPADPSGGCGRTAPALHGRRVGPGDTRVCIAHEYTQSSLRGAAALEPDKRDIPTHRAWRSDERPHCRPTLPSTIALERRIDPCLRGDMAVAAASTREPSAVDDQPMHVIATLREWKNRFR